MQWPNHYCCLLKQLYITYLPVLHVFYLNNNQQDYWLVENATMKSTFWLLNTMESNKVAWQFIVREIVFCVEIGK